MSYRSVKRVLGETHLEWKLLVAFGAAALLCICLSFWVYGRQTEKLVYRQNGQRARLLVNNILFHLHWKVVEEKNDVGKRLADAFSTEVETEDYRWERLSPTGIYLRPNQRLDQGQPLDATDRQILDQFLRGKPPAEKNDVEWDERRLSDRNEYHYYQAIRATGGACAICHSGLGRPPGAREGDVLGVIKVSISDKPVQTDIVWNNGMLAAMGIGTTFVLVIVSYFIIRYVIARPLQHLQSVSEAISRGEMDKRAEINSRDEFEALGTAFNKMVHSLIDSQNQIRQTNAELDRKVDELAQLNMQLYEMNRLKSDFLATVSHELRTPLNSIIGFSDVLSSVNSLDEKHRRYVQNVQTSGKMLLEMINDILDLAKIESGRMEVRPVDFRIEHVIGTQCELMRPMAEKKNIDLDVDIHPGMPELHQDQYKVQQILNNLLSNAVKFTPDGGRVVVRAGPASSGDFLLTVSDTGIGIAEADQSKIFEKFRQGQAALQGGDAMTREFSGTGLGLSIVKELCKLLGGEIMLESELGRGSTFTVRLPLHLSAEHDGDGLAMTSNGDGFTASRRRQEVSR
jgi:two-component system sensor histidine kinase BarA